MPNSIYSTRCVLFLDTRFLYTLETSSVTRRYLGYHHLFQRISIAAAIAERAVDRDARRKKRQLLADKGGITPACSVAKCVEAAVQRFQLVLVQVVFGGNAFERVVSVPGGRHALLIQSYNCKKSRRAYRNNTCFRLNLRKAYLVDRTSNALTFCEWDKTHTRDCGARRQRHQQCKYAA